MAPGLQLKHPEIATFSGRGIDDPKATIHADVSPLGFHASVRTSTGAWYIDPVLPPRPERLRLVLRPRRAGRRRGQGTTAFVERDASGAELSVDKGYYHADDDVSMSGERLPGGDAGSRSRSPIRRSNFADRGR